MTKQEYMQFHENFCKLMMEITKKKNHDYTGDNDDPFHNFRVVKMLGVCTVEQGFLTRMSDKMSRISSLITKEAMVKDESIQDTLHDLANYCALMSGYLESKKQEKLLVKEQGT